MGWTFTYHKNKSDLRNEILRDLKLNGEVLGHRTVGNHLWVAVRCGDLAYIMLHLLSKDKDYGWGYKDMSEDMKPYYYDCPLHLLELAGDPPSDEAREWRELVVQYHEETKRRKEMEKQIKVGTVVRLKDSRPDVLEVVNLAPLQGKADGKIYKIPKSRLADILVSQ